MGRIRVKTSRVLDLDYGTRTELMAVAIQSNRSITIFQHDDPTFIKYRRELIVKSDRPAIAESPATAPAPTENQTRWAQVRDTWKKAGTFIASLKSRVTEGRVSSEIRSLRVLSCHGIDASGKQVQPPCEARAFNEKKGNHYCDLCGCGKIELARTSSHSGTKDNPRFDESEYIKLDYPELECPLKKPGFSNEEKSAPSGAA